MLKLFGLASSSPSGPKPSSSEAERRALPASWYRSEAMYELERRAIFSRQWLLLTHMLRVAKAGDYVSFNIAGFPFFVIRDRDGNVNAFHNICRHRAYPIIDHDSGTARTLFCKYHGWSYGLKGNLAKAPRFDTVPTFEKSENGLLPIHTHVDNLGFIWVNLEAGEKPSIAWHADLAADAQPRYAVHNLMRDYHFDHTWTMDGDYNWKALADNYNECYHCPTGHPGVNAVADLSQYYVETVGGQIRHFNTNKDEEDKTMAVISTYLFPNSSITVTPHFFYIQRCIPVSASKTKMEYDVYRHNSAGDEDFDRINQFYKQVLQEDKDLCNGAQKNLNNRIFINGQLHPEKEKGPLYFQDTVRELVMSHRAQEEKENGGKEIWPASPKPTQAMKTAKMLEEELFCAGLAAGPCQGPSELSQLAW
ncbi:Putative aromatic-ring-hydroxylating dioxygenase, alpha subunit, rieske [2Fe-2S] iron-sulfur [Colletotrichum destructivum]|uniref:Choline monooxygenase, chloroplastic n=1 Tax=Colletotrichum destructivum TaxID=34406 RepID=A0AAX4IXU9_9PEZI|nr:Putative aromatic-ring-hydroxylating dioxygenase, alpha subunit, rieske [2Fe-2S] iron-sulfur [Colletotrichum destructivum]